MPTENLAQAKASLGEILGKADVGQKAIITRRGKAIAQLSAQSGPKLPLPIEELAVFRATMPRQSRPSNEILREIRDKG